MLPSGVLQVSAVRKDDAGMYRCRAVNMAKERHSDEAQLTVLPPISELFGCRLVMFRPVQSIKVILCSICLYFMLLV